ncbi:MAG: UDP-N-acetylglucosamine 1-carboxyvinyltransferase [Candidatus Mcinerneyibacterium aminivorans]|uniref:UDP-N-acetylglucosamine 1-carboxyvinyltransferase n=1 Tax=Candidatus Mcinerneyibacterium aminivorans TaxID=2703815 RepID=A0A5D0MJ24_9BACT|nr:MAG: UDP-N-acetylglucosamine 1-carboxyvinyltransferase [Candidatus Mcinerneyibacterium aminivorans]
MAYFEVEGKALLKGKLIPSGNKNEALPVIAATLLTNEDIILENVPAINDVKVLLDIIGSIGAEIEYVDEHKIKINTSGVERYDILNSLGGKIRGSLPLIAALLSKLNKVFFPIPGGDKIGRRRLDTHLLVLKKLGVEYTYDTDTDKLKFFAENGLKGNYILLDEASVTATENAIIGAVLAEGETSIYNAACEPHIQGLCKFLNSIGAKIKGIGTNLLNIKGVDNLGGGRYKIQDDYIEVGSFMGLAAVTGGEITLKDVYRSKTDYISIIGREFKRIGLNFKRKGDDLYIPPNQNMEIQPDFRNKIPKIGDGTWPKFPADLISIMIVSATQSKGSIIIHEKMFESRMFFVDKLISMGARVVLCDPHRVVVNGPSKLYGAEVVSPDIRAGISLLLAAMGAEGKSIIRNIYQIDRGYEKIDKRLNKIGAKIMRKG